MSLAEYQRLADEQAAARDAAQRFADQVRKTLGTDRVVWIRLYGSLARGDWRGADESDVDVAIVLEGRTGDDDRAIGVLAHQELMTSFFVISPKIFSPAQFYELHARELRLPREILEQGQLL